MASPKEEDDEDSFACDNDWGTDLNQLLISLVKEYSFLYNSKDKRYNDRDLLDRTWVKIGFNLGTTGNAAKLKWQRLRNSFGKAMERRRQKYPGNSAAARAQKPWIYEDEMTFLKEHITHQRKRSFQLTIERPEDDSMPKLSEGSVVSLAEERVAPDTYNNHPSQKSQRLETKKVEAPPIVSYLKDMARKEPEDPVVGWFKTLLPMIKSLPPLAFLDFQAKVVTELKDALVKEKSG